MNIYRKLYLGSGFFYLCGTCIFLFFLSYKITWLFYPALLLTVTACTLLIVDITVLFRRKTVSAERQVNDVLSLNDGNEVRLIIRNLTGRRLRMRVIDEMPWQIGNRDFETALELNRGAGEQIRYELHPRERGEYVFENVNVFVKSGLGFAVKREMFGLHKTVAVYPSVIQMAREQRIAMHHPAFASGENRTMKRGQSYEFDQVRQYVPGDDTRNINWKASSSVNEVMVNTYEDERSQQIYSVIDKSRIMKMPFGGLTLVDYAINATLAFSNIVVRKEDKAGLMIFSSKVNTFVKAERGLRQLKKIMYALYREKYDYADADYESLYVSIRHNIANRSLLFLYTSFDSIYALERNLPALKLINRYHLLVVVYFENEELKKFSSAEAVNLLDIYQVTIARKMLLEKEQIYRELSRHGIQAIRCTPAELSTRTINKYLDLKARGMI